MAAGAIHVAAAATVGRGSAQNLAFFGVVAAAQIVWGAVALAWAPRWWLALGALGNAVVVATWVVSRTVGLPFGEFAGVVLPVGFADALATIFGAATAVGAAWLAVRGSGPARSAARVRGFALAAAVVIGALGLTGVLSQSGAFASNGGRRRPERSDRAQRWRRLRRGLRLLTDAIRSTNSERRPAALGRIRPSAAGHQWASLEGNEGLRIRFIAPLIAG